MSQDFLDFEDQYTPTIQEEEEMYHYSQVQQAKSIFNHSLGKNDIPVIVNTMVESVLHNGNPLEIAEKVKVMEEIIKGFKEDSRYKRYAIEEAAKYGKEGYTSPTGAKIQTMNTGGGKPDFKVCNDPLVLDLEKRLEERKKYLSNLPAKGVDEVQETGEVIHLWPATKSPSTETIKVTLK